MSRSKFTRITTASNPIEATYHNIAPTVWISKLLGFDFRVEYRSGKSNVVADALSRRDDSESGYVCALSFPRIKWLAEIRTDLATQMELKPLIEKVKAGEALGP